MLVGPLLLLLFGVVVEVVVDAGAGFRGVIAGDSVRYVGFGWVRYIVSWFAVPIWKKLMVVLGYGEEVHVWKVVAKTWKF